MSRRLEVLEALKQLVADALPDAEVVGLTGDEAPPARVKAGGRVVIRTGDPGDPEVDLCPVTYHYAHRIPLEVATSSECGGERAIDALLQPIGVAIRANRQLGGLCSWLEAVAPTTEDIYVEGARPPRGADLIVVAHYATADPLNT